MMFTGILYLAIPLSILTGYFFPPLDWMGDARVFLVPSVFIFGALALPFPSMLMLAAYTGLLWDLVEIPITESGAELRPGWSILAFAVLGAVAQGFRPLFAAKQGRWEVHCLMSAAATSTYLLVQYLYLSVVRGLPEFHWGVWSRILGAGAVILFLAPIIHIILASLMRMSGFEVRVEHSPAYSEQY